MTEQTDRQPGTINDLQQKIPRSTLICYFQNELFSSIGGCVIHWRYHLCYNHLNCNKRFHALHSFATFIMNHSPQMRERERERERESEREFGGCVIYRRYHLCSKHRNCNKRFRALNAFVTFRMNHSHQMRESLAVSSLLQASELQQNIPRSRLICYFHNEPFSSNEKERERERVRVW